MDFMTWWIIGIVVGGTLLTLLLTGPGMWSEKWGWKWLEGKKPPEPKKPPEAAKPPATAKPPET